jgi:zinc protease
MRMTAQTLVIMSVTMLAAAAAIAAPAAGKAGGAGKVEGIRTVFLQSSSSPLVAIRLFFQVGSVDDPAGKEGLVQLTAEMLGKGGSKDRTYAEVLEALYPLAAQISVHGDKESIVFEGMVHRDNLDKFADLLSAQVLTPRFADDDFTRNRQDALDYVTKTLRGNADEDLGKQAMATVMYRGHPYAHPPAGTVAGLTSATLADVRKLHETLFTRDRLIVGVAGGYPDGFAEAFARRFKALPAKSPPTKKLPPPPVQKGNQLLVVEKPAQANAISFGRPIRITRSDPDFYPLTVARSYLGEHRTFNGVLMQHLRERRALNYGDYAYIENFIQDGWSTFPLPNIPRRQQHFEIWLRPVKPANSLFALRAALFETDKLIREGIPQSAFDTTRTFLANYSNLWAQDVSRRLGFAIDGVVYGKDLINELQARLPKMKKADVDRAIRKHLSLSGLTFVIVAEKGQEVADKLVSGGPTGITYDTGGTPESVIAEDDIIKRFPITIQKESARVVPVEQMFEK